MDKFRVAMTLTAVLGITPQALADEFVPFRSPSGNIHCMAMTIDGARSLECELRERNSEKPLLPQPADCDLDWGDRFYVQEKSGAGLGCHGDTVADPNGLVLPYGQTFEYGDITCLSEKTGLTCRNAEGRGFFLSRARQHVF